MPASRRPASDAHFQSLCISNSTECMREYRCRRYHRAPLPVWGSDPLEPSRRILPTPWSGTLPKPGTVIDPSRPSEIQLKRRAVDTACRQSPAYIRPANINVSTVFRVHWMGAYPSTQSPRIIQNLFHGCWIPKDGPGRCCVGQLWVVVLHSISQRANGILVDNAPARGRFVDRERGGRGLELTEYTCCTRSWRRGSCISRLHTRD